MVIVVRGRCSSTVDIPSFSKSRLGCARCGCPGCSGTRPCACELHHKLASLVGDGLHVEPTTNFWAFLCSSECFVLLHPYASTIIVTILTRTCPYYSISDHAPQPASGLLLYRDSASGRKFVYAQLSWRGWEQPPGLHLDQYPIELYGPWSSRQ